MTQKWLFSLKKGGPYSRVDLIHFGPYNRVLLYIVYSENNG